MAEYYAEKKVTNPDGEYFENDVTERGFCAAVSLGHLNEEEMDVWKRHVGEYEQIELPENWSLEYRSPLWTPENSFHPVVVIPKHTIDTSDLHVKVMFHRRLNSYFDDTLLTQSSELVKTLKYCEQCANEIHDVGKSVDSNEINDDTTSAGNSRTPILSVNERLILFFMRYPRSTLKAQKLAILLGCTTQAIYNTPIWRTVRGRRVGEKNDRRKKLQNGDYYDPESDKLHD